MLHQRQIIQLTTAMCFAGLCLVGCDKVSELTEKAKEAASDAAENINEKAAELKEKAQDAKETLSLAGSIDLATNPPVKASACYVSFVTSSSGRPNILKIQSYRDAASESYPSVYLQAQVKASTPGGLVAEPVNAQLFVQLVKDGPVLFSAPGSPVQLQITSFDDKSFAGKVTGGNVFNTQTEASVPVQGTLSGIVQ